MAARMHRWRGLVVIGFLFTACDQSEKAPQDVSMNQSVFSSPSEVQEHLASLVEYRREKDKFFKDNEDSPVKDEDRVAFRGLKYYDPTEAFIFRVTLQKFEKPETLKMGTTTGDLRDAVKYGYFDFTVRGRSQRLHVYKFTPDLGSYLFVPFTDSTNGKETYGAGRYLDFEESQTGTYLLDFNLAYNPSCAYNENYSCPIPPKENRLDVATEAGEKNFH